MLKTALLGILTIVIAMAMKQGKAEYGLFVSFTGSILIAWIAIQLLEGISVSLNRLERMLTIDMEYIALLIKMIGVTYLSEFASSLCRDAGYSAVAGQPRNGSLIDNTVTIMTSVMRGDDWYYFEVDLDAIEALLQQNN